MLGVRTHKFIVSARGAKNTFNHKKFKWLEGGEYIELTTLFSINYSSEPPTTQMSVVFLRGENMKHIFLIFGLLATTPAVADAAISSVNYARQFVYQYCKNPNMQLPGTENTSLASQKYILGLVDFMNENKTTYAASSKTDNVASVGYLRESLGKIQSSDVCCPTGYFNVTDGKCANCGIYVPTGTCPDNFTEIPLQNVSLPGAGGDCPSGTENYSTLPDGCAGNATGQISMCVPLPQLKSVQFFVKRLDNSDNNRGYFAFGTGCKLTDTGYVCDDTIMTGETHCGASAELTDENWENFGQLCWYRLTSVKTASNNIVANTPQWHFMGNYAAVGNSCISYCYQAYANIMRSNPMHPTSVHMYFKFGESK